MMLWAVWIIAIVARSSATQVPVNQPEWSWQNGGIQVANEPDNSGKEEIPEKSLILNASPNANAEFADNGPTEQRSVRN